MKVWLQVEGQEVNTFDGAAGEISMVVVEHLNRSYQGNVSSKYSASLTAALNKLLKQQYNGSELNGVFGIGADKLFYEIKVAEQHGDLQDLDFLVPWE